MAGKDSLCNDARCIGITIRRSDGAILDTRYLYVIRGYGLTSQP